MNNLIDKMKHIWKLNAYDARELRRYELKCAKKAKRSRANVPVWQDKRMSAYLERIELRKEQRLLGLARAFLMGKKYHEVENSVREGNEVDPADLVLEFHYWSMDVDIVTLGDWLEGVEEETAKEA